MDIKFIGVVFIDSAPIRFFPAETDADADMQSAIAYSEILATGVDPAKVERDVFARVPPREPTVRWPSSADVGEQTGSGI